jgi:hypothetical protein
MAEKKYIKKIKNKKLMGFDP